MDPRIAATSRKSAMIDKSFNPAEYYASYPQRVILRPGYPARAQYKSTLMWSLYGKQILGELGEIKTYADVGGCFGFGANSMAFQINKCQGYYPKTAVFEISRDFVTLGKQMFPYIDFIEGEFDKWNGEPRKFDLVTLFDVVEHITNPGDFLRALSLRTDFALLNTPLETSGEWLGSRPPAKQGEDHPDGHVNFFDCKTYEKLLEDSGFQIMKRRLVRNICPRGTNAILIPEWRQPSLRSLLTSPKLLTRRLGGIVLSQLPFRFSRKILGHGNHLSLVKSIHPSKAKPSGA